MNRLQQELHRLYGDAQHPRLALLELARPPDWSSLAVVWRAVQAELGLPAPAIAVAGPSGFQLWFALAEPGLAAAAAELLQRLCQREFSALQPKTSRLRIWTAASSIPDALQPSVSPSAPPLAQPLAPPSAPPQRLAPEQWSAFVAPDLAPVFSEEPWLDTEPSPDAQADVLARLKCISAVQLHAALAQLREQASAALPEEAPVPCNEVAAPTAPVAVAPADPMPMEHKDPRAFLLRVMNDAQQPMALRIEAAKALLGAEGKQV